MQIRELDLQGVFELAPKKFNDERGFLSETFSLPAMIAAGLPADWVQDNHSHSISPYTLRGLHYQAPPRAQGKLLRVARGAILDVVVDIRRGSPRFGTWASLVVSEERWNQIFIPEGFAHGFVTLQPNTAVVYKVSEFYSPEHDRSILWNDPALGIDWGLEGNEPLLSARDRNAPLLREQDSEFYFGETR